MQWILISLIIWFFFKFNQLFSCFFFYYLLLAGFFGFNQLISCYFFFICFLQYIYTIVYSKFPFCCLDITTKWLIVKETILCKLKEQTSWEMQKKIADEEFALEEILNCAKISTKSYPKLIVLLRNNIHLVKKLFRAGYLVSKNTTTLLRRIKLKLMNWWLRLGMF